MKISLRQLRTIIQEELARAEMSFKNKESDVELFDEAEIDEIAEKLSEDPEELKKFEQLKKLEKQLKSLSNKAEKKPPIRRSHYTPYSGNDFEVISNLQLLKPTGVPIGKPPSTEEADKELLRLTELIAPLLLSLLGFSEMAGSAIAQSQRGFEESVEILKYSLITLGAVKLHQGISNFVDKVKEKLAHRRSFEYVPPPGKNPGKGSFYNIGD